MNYRAASHGNLEALIKLGIAHLYNEGSKYNERDCLTVVVVSHLSYWSSELRAPYF